MTSRISDSAILIAAAGWHDESPGGANKLPTDFARYLVRRGHRVVYLCASDSVDRITQTEIDGVDLRRYPSPNAPSPSVHNVRRHWTLTRQIVRAVQAERTITVLLGHAPLQTLAASSACGPGVRRCYGAHSPLPEELAQGASGRTLKQRFAGRLAWLIEWRLLLASNLVHCDSEYSRGLMQSRYPRVLNGKAIVLPGWVDVSRFHTRSISRDALRTRLGPPWTPGVPTFFSLRRLVPRMGLDTLIEATALLAQKGQECQVAIGGEGPERQSLERLALERGVGDRIAFLGRISEQQLNDCYAAADCFVLPTRALECFGLIVLEAYASGVPVVGVPVGSIPEVMGAEFSAWIADDNRPAAIAQRMGDFLSGRLVADPIRLRCRAMEFDMERVAGQHERVLLQNGAAKISVVERLLIGAGRVIGKPPGWERTVRAFAPPSRYSGGETRPTRFPEGYVFPVDPATLIGWSIYFFGTYEPEVRVQLIERLTRGSVAIDVGANVGWHALLMASKVGPSGRVYAFEPNDSTRDRLRAAVDANGLTQITIEAHALADRQGALGFDAPQAGQLWDGTGRLSRDATRSTRTVECVTLDAFVASHSIDRLALIKIDVEGWELTVLRGAKQVLQTLRPAVVFEFDPEYVGRSGGTGADLAACFVEAGYELFALSTGHAPLAVAGLGDRVGNFLALPHEQVRAGE